MKTYFDHEKLDVYREAIARFYTRPEFLREEAPGVGVEREREHEHDYEEQK